MKLSFNGNVTVVGLYLQWVKARIQKLHLGLNASLDLNSCPLGCHRLSFCEMPGVYFNYKASTIPSLRNL